MSMYCKSWCIIVNTDKTVVMLCKTCNRTPYFHIFYDNRKLKVVETFTYLGVTLSSNGRFYMSFTTGRLNSTRKFGFFHGF